MLVLSHPGFLNFTPFLDLVSVLPLLAPLRRWTEPASVPPPCMQWLALYLCLFRCYSCSCASVFFLRATVVPVFVLDPVLLPLLLLLHVLVPMPVVVPLPLPSYARGCTCVRSLPCARICACVCAWGCACACAFACACA